ncbi:MAG: cyclopropane-fatty-acyl-phospholipid synthase, partial [Rickettsiales bacterium]
MKRKIFKHLEKAKHGYLKITTPCGNDIEIGDKKSQIQADIQIKDWSLLDLVLSKGDIGFGEGYIKGQFTSSKIENLLLFISLNHKEFEAIFHSNIIYSIF